MNQAKSGVSVGSAVAVVLVVITVVVSVGLFVGNQFFWKPADERTIADIKLDNTKQQYLKNPKSIGAKLGYAVSLHYKKEDKLAGKLFDELLKDYPKDNAVLVNAAMFKRDIGKKEEATKLFETLLKNAPYFTLGNVEYGIMLREQGKYSEAIKKFDNSLKLDPGAADVLLEKAKVYVAMKDKAKAKELINKALQFYPDYQEAKQILKELE